MATFRTYAEVLGPGHPLMKNKARNASWSPSRYRSAEIEQAMRAEPGVALGDVLRQTGGASETTTRLTPRFREDKSPRLRRRLALPPDPRITLHFDEIVFPGTSGRFWSAMHWDTPGQKTGDRPAAPHG